MNFKDQVNTQANIKSYTAKGGTRAARVTVNLDRVEHEKLLDAAARRGVTVSNYIRALIATATRPKGYKVAP